MIVDIVAVWLLGSESTTGLDTVAVTEMVAPAAATTLMVLAFRLPLRILLVVHTMAASVPVQPLGRRRSRIGPPVTAASMVA